MDYTFGAIARGTDLSFTAAEFVDRVLGIEASFGAAQFRLTGATLDGAQAVLGDVGVSFQAGVGEAGTLLIATEGVAAFSAASDAAPVEVVLSYEVTRGNTTDTGTLSFTVDGAEGDLARDVAVSLQDDTAGAGDLQASVTAEAGESLAEIAIADHRALADVLEVLMLSEDVLVSTSDPLDFTTLSIAYAEAEDSATATATAQFGIA
ncbi:MAG: hypothetical protein AAF986_01065, partial [Pseudomonadota bacterium]